MRKNGYSLVEVLVAAAILIIAILAIIAVVRKGRELDITDRHRRVARATIMSRFENPSYRYDNYDNVAPLNGQTVIIDPRDTATTTDDLTGTLVITVAPEDTLQGASNTPIPFKEVTMRITWQEPGPLNEQVEIKKQISKCE